MKWFFTLLLALNAAFVFLELAPLSVPSRPASSAPHEGQGSANLLLLSELDPDVRPRRREQTDPSTERPTLETPVSVLQGDARAPGARQACARIVLDSEVRAVRLSEQLVENGATVSLSPIKGQRDAFWVFAPRQKTREATERLMVILRRADVRDYYLIRAGEHRNILSLGVFSSDASARRRVEDLRQLGVETRIQPRTILVQQYMLLIDWGDKQPLWPVKEIQPETVSCR